ncbi:MAG: hypothetical protein KF718_33375 [Polyangiaceae bacterium]|nr:hypothetical protein [Polyangiaceae bacterium]
MSKRQRLVVGLLLVAGTCSAEKSFARLYSLHVEPGDVQRHAERACRGNHVLAWELQYNEPLLLEIRK